MRGNLIAMFRLKEGIDKYGNEDLIVHDKQTTGGTGRNSRRTHVGKL